MKRLMPWLFLIFLAAQGFGQDDGRQVVEGDALKDLDYGFVLKKPSGQWIFLKQDSIRKMNPDALAGLACAKSKVFTVVVAEEMPETEAKDYVDLVIESQSMENKQVVFRKEVAFGGLKAHQFKVKGEINGVRFTSLTTIFRRESFYFQVVSFWPTELARVDNTEIDAIHSSFSFIPGVRPKVRMPKSADKMYGIGWRMEKGVYQNAVYGFSFKLPSKEWRFMDSVELKDMHPDAALGLEHAASGIYTLVIAEKVGKTSQEEYEKTLAGDFEKENECEEYIKTRVRVGASEVTQHVFKKARLAGITMDVFVVAALRGQTGFQIISYCVSSEGKDPSAEVGKIYEKFCWLTREEKEKLTREFLKFADVERSVTRDECFRNRTYTNFSFGISISFPRGFWQHLIGMDARMENEDASLVFTNLEHDVLGTAVLEETDEFTAEQYHKLILESLELPEGTKTEKIKASGVEVLSTRFSCNEEGLDFTYHLATASKDGRHLQLLMYGLECNLKETRDLEMQLLKSIRFDPKKIRATQRLEDGSFVCNRMGFKVTPPDKAWPVAEITPSATKALGTLVLLMKPGVKAMCAAGAMHADVNVDDLISAIFSSSESLKDLNLKLVSKSSVKWLGLDAWSYKYEGKSGSLEREVEFLGAPLGGTYYLLITVKSKDAGATVNFRDCFKLIP